MTWTFRLFRFIRKGFLTTAALAVAAAAAGSTPRRQAPEPWIRYKPAAPAWKLSPKIKTAPFSLKEFADRIEAALKDKTVGYQFVVSFGTNQAVVRAGGFARRNPDGSRAMTADDRYNVASVSKTVTAAAVMKLLAAQNRSVDAGMHSWLPPHFKLGPNVKTITIRELLTHRSGIRCSSHEGYQELKACLAKGINLSDKNQWSYNNNNFGLLRFVVARLNGYDGKLKTTGEARTFEENQDELRYGNLYMDYVRANIFAPAGLGALHCGPMSKSPALSYQHPEPKIAGDHFGDMSRTNASSHDACVSRSSEGNHWSKRIPAETAARHCAAETL